MVQAAEAASGEIVPLAPNERLLGMYFDVSFALRFDHKASIEDLASSFSTVLSSFQVLAGRFVTHTEALSVLCSNEGVPLSHEEAAGPVGAGPVGSCR